MSFLKEKRGAQKRAEFLEVVTGAVGLAKTVLGGGKSKKSEESSNVSTKEVIAAYEQGKAEGEKKAYKKMLEFKAPENATYA